MKRLSLIIAGAVTLTLLASYCLLFRSTAFQVRPKGILRPISSDTIQTPLSKKKALSKRVGSGPTLANLTEKDERNIGKIVAAFKAPINFYGKVVDQHGRPIAGAQIHYSAADQYFGHSSKYDGLSDADGLFSITGIRGAGLYVNVSKSGYSGMERSAMSFGYGVPSGNRPPTKASPALFRLREQGPTEPLILISSRQYELSKRGEPVDINLRNGHKVEIGQADIQVESWISDESKDEKGQFDWKVRVAAPGGGLLERTDPELFEAPNQGYYGSEEINMPRWTSEWKRSVKRDYFVKVRENTYARVRLEVFAGGAYKFFTLESYLNPSGGRSLEFDAEKVIRPVR